VGKPLEAGEPSTKKTAGKITGQQQVPPSRVREKKNRNSNPSTRKITIFYEQPFPLRKAERFTKNVTIGSQLRRIDL